MRDLIGFLSLLSYIPAVRQTRLVYCFYKSSFARLIVWHQLQTERPFVVIRTVASPSEKKERGGGCGERRKLRALTLQT